MWKWRMWRREETSRRDDVATVEWDVGDVVVCCGEGKRTSNKQGKSRAIAHRYQYHIA